MIWVTGITWAGYIWRQIIEEAINLWYIKNYDYRVPDWVEKKSYCLDINCFRVENNFDFSNKNYFSRIRDNYYDRKDILQKLNEYEEQKLFDLRFYLK